MLFIGYPKCINSQRAQAWLDEHGLEYEYKDLTEETPSYEDFRKWHQLSGLPIKRYFNTSGLLYREMGLRTALKSMTEDEMLHLLATDCQIPRRPILVDEERNISLVGFKLQEWEDALLKYATEPKPQMVEEEELEDSQQEDIAKDALK